MIVVDIIIKLTGTDKEMKLLSDLPICSYTCSVFRLKKRIYGTVGLMLDIIIALK